MEISNDEDFDATAVLQQPRRFTLWRCLIKMHKHHWKCFMLTAVNLTCICIISWCQFSVDRTVWKGTGSFNYRHEVIHRPCDPGYIYIPIAFLVMFYLIYLIECWNCPIRLESCSTVDADSAYRVLEDLRAASPLLWWRAAAYHYVRRQGNGTVAARYRSVGSSTGGNSRRGGVSTSGQHYERVITRTERAAFNVVRCGVKDASRKVIGLEDWPLIRLSISYGYTFVHPSAESEYEHQRSTFYSEHEAYDHYMEAKEGLELLNVQTPDPFLIVPNIRHRPRFLSNWVFFFASLFLLSWPLRIWILSQTAYLNFHVQKAFGNNYLAENVPVTSDDYALPQQYTGFLHESDLPLDATFNSVNISMLPPSYSEALRLCISDGDEQNNESLILTNPESREAHNDPVCTVSKQIHPPNLSSSSIRLTPTIYNALRRAPSDPNIASCVMPKLPTSQSFSSGFRRSSRPLAIRCSFQRSGSSLRRSESWLSNISKHLRRVTRSYSLLPIETTATEEQIGESCDPSKTVATSGV